MTKIIFQNDFTQRVINGSQTNFTPEMSVIFVLIIASLVVALSFLIAFIWSVKSGQFDDPYTPSVRILFDGNKTPERENQVNNQKSN